MVCDGDSKAYNSVWDVYACCKTCEKYEIWIDRVRNMKNWSSQRHKKNMKKKVLLCQRVKKLDCIGHVQKRLGTALRDYKKKSKGKLKDGKAVGGKGHKTIRQNY